MTATTAINRRPRFMLSPSIHRSFPARAPSRRAAGPSDWAGAMPGRGASPRARPAGPTLTGQRARAEGVRTLHDRWAAHYQLPPPPPPPLPPPPKPPKLPPPPDPPPKPPPNPPNPPP